jgi:hypothetical protein
MSLPRPSDFGSYSVTMNDNYLVVIRDGLSIQIDINKSSLSVDVLVDGIVTPDFAIKAEIDTLFPTRLYKQTIQYALSKVAPALSFPDTLLSNCHKASLSPEQAIECLFHEKAMNISGLLPLVVTKERHLTYRQWKEQFERPYIGISEVVFAGLLETGSSYFTSPWGRVFFAARADTYGTEFRHALMPLKIDKTEAMLALR